MYPKRNLAMAKKPVKLMSVKPSKYDSAQAINNNKKYWENAFKNLHSQDNEVQVDKNDASILFEALPEDLCVKVSKILGITVPSPERQETRIATEHTQRISTKEPFISKRKTIVVDREMDSDTEVEVLSSNGEEEHSDVHFDFLKKPIREQITWATRYLAPEREDEKSLVKRADDLTDKIAQEFCDYMKELGGDRQSQLFTPKAIKELFQIEFNTPVSRGLQVVPKEIPAVNENIAIVTGSAEKSIVATLDKQIIDDTKAEKIPDYVLSFQRSVPKQDQYHNPRNNTKKFWQSARHVPRDLITLKTVWEGITNLRSVKEYCRWMIEHPEFKRAPYLNSLGMFDSAVLDSRLTFEVQPKLPRPVICSTITKPGNYADRK